MVWRADLIPWGAILLLQLGCQANPTSPILSQDVDIVADASSIADTSSLFDASDMKGAEDDALPDEGNQALDPSMFVRGSMNLTAHWDIREDPGASWSEGGNIIVQALSDFPEPSTIESPNVEMEILGRVLLEGAWCVRGKVRRPSTMWTEFEWQCRTADGTNVVVISEDERLQVTLQVFQVSEF